jgi:hypothetical protein
VFSQNPPTVVLILPSPIRMSRMVMFPVYFWNGGLVLAR